MKLNQTKMGLACICAIGALFTGNSQALTLSAISDGGTPAIYPNASWWGNTGNPDAAAVSATTSFAVTEYYRANNNVTEVGTLLGSYDSNLSAGMTSGVTITYTGGLTVGGTHMYALARDGNSDPNWFIWDLSALGWNGMETLLFNPAMFFHTNPGNGSTQTQSFSHVVLFGQATGPGGTPTPQSEVPEGGATLALLGLGLTGVGTMRRFIKKA